MTEKYKLYGAEFSLYSGKVRSYLRKKGIPFEEVNPSIKVYKKFIVPRTGVRYIPVVQTPDDEVLQDTSIIIDTLEKRFPEKSVFPLSPKQKLVSLLLEVYGDEWLLIPAMHFRWYYKEVNHKFIFGEFGKMLFPRLPAFLQHFAGKKIAARFQNSVARLGVTEENKEAIEWSYLQLLSHLNAHFNQHDFLLGERPCIGDYGLIAPFYAHLYRDPYPGKLMRDQAPAVVRWVERMLSSDVATGKFLPNDYIPETLFPILQRMANEQLLPLLDTDIRLTNWRSENPNTDIPRFIGMHEFSVEGVLAKRVVTPYSLWMWQRPYDFYHSLSPEEKQNMSKLLETTGIGMALESRLSNRLTRENNQLKFA